DYYASGKGPYNNRDNRNEPKKSASQDGAFCAAANSNNPFGYAPNMCYNCGLPDHKVSGCFGRGCRFCSTFKHDAGKCTAKRVAQKAVVVDNNTAAHTAAKELIAEMKEAAAQLQVSVYQSRHISPNI